MRALNSSEKRTIRLGAIVMGIFLAIISWRYFEARRFEYKQLVKQALTLKEQMQPYEDKALLVQTLMENFKLDPAKLSKASLVGEASSAIQKAAASGGIQFGPIRESPGRPSAKELASMKLEGFGPLSSVTTFLKRLETLGFPLVVDSVQLNPDNMRPGTVKLSLTVIIMDFEQWKNPEAPDA